MAKVEFEVDLCQLEAPNNQKSKDLNKFCNISNGYKMDGRN